MTRIKEKSYWKSRFHQKQKERRAVNHCSIRSLSSQAGKKMCVNSVCVRVRVRARKHMAVWDIWRLIWIFIIENYYEINLTFHCT